MRICLAILVMLLSPSASSDQTAPPWKSKTYHSLMDGNELYADCEQWEVGFTISPDRRIRSKPNSGADEFQGGTCWGYVIATVNSIPADEGFDPGPHVRGSQYIDVVFQYL